MHSIGKQFIDGKRIGESGEVFTSFNAATGEPLPFTFYQATDLDIENAVAAAARAHPLYRKTGIEARAAFLEVIAAEIDSLDDSFVQLVMQETGLPEARVRGERLRTTNQLRLFATVVRRGDFLRARIDTALPHRQPLPRQDIRQYRTGIGPVAVFGAGNFPLAFSVAGGDTASALAAGCPVVIKAHPAHPATSEIVGGAIVRAIEICNMPTGVFGMVFGGTVGATLVKAPAIKAVAFTGSLNGGRALCDIAANRPDPIPVFAEMSSINPVILLPEALAKRGEAIAGGLAASVTLGSGQFCTKPGLVIGFKGEAFDRFCKQFAKAMGQMEPAVMLTQGIRENFEHGVARLLKTRGVEMLAGGAETEGRAQPCVLLADASMLDDPGHLLEKEVFGPTTVLVALNGLQELVDLLPRLNGHLTASMFAELGELGDCLLLVNALESLAGRLILNDYPTGVEVCDAMVHGGPYPATSDSRFTSVGTLAIDRFLRPVCYQGYPNVALPDALKNENPLGLKRLVNGEWSDGAISG